MSNIDFLHHVRQFELERALPSFPDPQAGLVLDIGAGTGRQAQLLATRGLRVTAVDVASRAYRRQSVYPVAAYDGRTLPVTSGTVAEAFTANVLEHVVDIDDFLDEIGRALGPGGCATHILPTPTWRFWTIVGHYGWLGKRLFAGLFGRQSKSLTDTRSRQAPTFWRGLVSILLPRRHRERGVTLTEMYYFSRYWWTRRFAVHDFRIITSYPTGLSYSGAHIFGDQLSFAWRRRLSPLVGSACRVYVLRHF